jgi:hypothetical protein
MRVAIAEQRGLYPFGFEAGMVIATTPAMSVRAAISVRGGIVATPIIMKL